MIEKIIIWNPSSDRIDTHDEDFSGDEETKNEITMNREIKFRVWDDETKTMIYPHESKYRPHHQWFTKENTIEYANMQNGFTTTQFMQFTGLKDKNGKEIYEGDIISESIYDIPAVYCGEDVFTIEYLQSGFAKIDIQDRNRIWCLCEYFIPHAVLNNLDNIEVIGNIFENPELL